MLGDLYFSSKNYIGTIKAYEKSIAIKPDNPEIINNLAWLYATCEDQSLRDPKKAISLAKKALDLKETPHILDTLAESYYVNEKYKDAVEAEKRALDLTPKNRFYYEKQLKRFMKAAQKEADG